MKNILRGNGEENKLRLIEKVGNYSVQIAEKSMGSLCLNWIFYEPKISDELINHMKENEK